MRLTIKILFMLGAGALLSSCSNYSYISENDVYMQKPTEINLGEDENDLTSFNAFKAKQKGAFTDEYKDPRGNTRMQMNQFLIISSYQPFGSSYGMFNNRPIAFHGMNNHNFYNNPFMSSGFYSGYGMYNGYGTHGMYGNGFYSPYSPFGYHSPFGYGSPYGYGYNSYYGSGYYGGYGGYGGYDNVVDGNSGESASQNIFYGQRRSLTSSSNRSSNYQNNQFKSYGTSNVSYDVNDQSLGESRRDVERRNAGGSDYNKKNGSKFTYNGVPIENKNEVQGQQSRTNEHRRAVSNSYTPNASARRSGVTNASRRSRTTPSTNRQGAGSTSRRTNSSSNAQRSPSIQSRGNSSSTPRMSTPQRSSSSPSRSSSGGSSRRSSGSSSSSGRR